MTGEGPAWASAKEGSSAIARSNAISAPAWGGEKKIGPPQYRHQAPRGDPRAHLVAKSVLHDSFLPFVVRLRAKGINKGKMCHEWP